MTSSSRTSRTPHDPGEEELLARCIERYGELGLDAADEIGAGDRALAQRLRARLTTLERMGLLGADADGAPLSIGHYRVLACLGSGGMGSVYLAADDQSGERVAIKVGHGTHAGADGGASRALLRFEREIRAVAELEHEGIVAIRDVGEDGGRPYFAMEFVEGATLARVLDELRARGVAFDALTAASIREIVATGAGAPAAPAAAGSGSHWGRTYVETVCRIAIDVAEALAHAHAHGIVHRDVKPANVIVRLDGRAKVFDLGLAHVEDQPGLTRSGELAGSPYYVSPEQVDGSPQRIDRRTDVYSLGVTLFELLTLRRPFEGPGTARVLRQIQSKEPPLLRAIHPHVPRDLETIVLTALEKDPDRRYPSMEELAADLRRFLEFKPVRAKPASPARRMVRFARRNPAPSAALALALLVAIGLPIGLAIANAAVRAEERRTAEAAASALREAGLKAQVLDFLVDTFRLTGAERAQGETISARELLDRGAERIEDEFATDARARASLYQATGTAYANLGLIARAIEQLDRALAIRQSQPDGDPAELSLLLDQLARAHLAAGNAKAAELLSRRGLAALEEKGRGESAQAADALATLAEAERQGGNLTLAQGTLERALALATRVHGADSRECARVHAQLGALACERGELDASLAHLVRALALEERAWSPDLDALGRVLEELARTHARRGEREQADMRSAQAASLARRPGVAPQVVQLPFEVDAPGHAQFQQQFQEGITALQSHSAVGAARAFERCLALDPSHSVAAYNIACAHALAGEVELALARLDQALELGFASVESRVETLEADVDLAGVRADPRFASVLERARASRERVRAFAGKPAIHLPAALDPSSTFPLLVVLHRDGESKDAALAVWRGLADELGIALLAPSAPYAIGSVPERGMRWFEDPADLAREPSRSEDTVDSAVRAFLASHPVDRQRLWIAGEGSGGTVAFDLALRAPGLYRGVIVVDGPLHPETDSARAARAAALGLRVAALYDGARPPRVVAGAESTWLERARGWFDQSGLRAQVAVLGSEGELAAAIAECLRAWRR